MEKIYDSQMNVHDFIKAMFEKNIVSGLGALTQLPDNKGISYSLLSDGFDFQKCMPFYPVMPANAAIAVSKLTRETSPSSPIAVFLRPCELRALIELTKIKQARLDNLILISFDCSGVFPFKDGKYPTEDTLKRYDQSIKEAKINDTIRQVCKGCENYQPEGADIAISIIGRGVHESLALSFATEKGKSIQEKMGLTASEIQPSTIEQLTSDKKRNKQELFKNTQISNLDELLDVFDTCIACRACSYVCPICYCKNCYFDSQTFQYYPENYAQRLNKKNTLRLPLDRIFFHMGRLSHMGSSCVACGMCSDVCPVDIPVSEMFKAGGQNIQGVFNYQPGQNLDEPMPLVTYQEKELHEMED
ncbi:MAG: hypothetical protein HQK75_08925 [Candidatus Magnetomorum sp.]|nr:hypothetical protein [Candidatus Magnetomorum sp.]